MSHNESRKGEDQVYLDSVIENLQTGKLKDRLQNLKDLKAIFDKSNKADNLSKLADKSYHRVYEVAFKIALEEKANVVIGKKSTLSRAQNRLEVCADAIRLAIKAGAPKLKHKTIQAVVDHITQTLPQSSGEYFPELSRPYLKALGFIFEHRPNAERLHNSLWLEVVEFCLDGIDHYMDSNFDDANSLTLSFSGLGAGHISGSGSAPTSSLANGISQTKTGSISRQNVEDLLNILLPLISATNAPILDNAERITNTVLSLLKSRTFAVNAVHQLAFSILNTVLLFCRQDQCSLVQNVVQRSIALIPRFWQGKFNTKDQMLNSVRDETIILFFIIHLHLERSLSEDPTSSLLSQTEDLLNVLRTEYSRRSERDQLQLQDLEMVNQGGSLRALTPFSLHAFRLRPHNTHSERNWANLQVIGLLERLLSLDDERRKQEAQKINDTLVDHPRKRQKTDQRANGLLDQIKNGDARLRLAGLQILPFVLQVCQFPTTFLEELLVQLGTCTSDKGDHIASWAFLAIASCTHQAALAGQTHVDWSYLWRTGSRALTFQGTCRAAATHMHSIVATGFVKYHEVSEDIDTMITSADISGPAILCDSSVFFMMHTLHTRVTEVPGASLAASNNVIRWLFARWNPADKTLDAQSVQVPPHHLVDLLRTCLGLARVPVPVFSSITCGPIAQAWQQHLNTEDEIRYLLLLGKSPTAVSIGRCKSCPKYSTVKDTLCILDNAHFQMNRKLILELLNPKVSELLSSWSDISTISADAFRCAVTATMTVLLLTSYFTDSRLPQVQTLENNIEGLLNKLLKILSESSSENSTETETRTEILLRGISNYLPACKYMESTIRLNLAPQFLRFFYRLSESLSTLPPEMSNRMDIDDDDSSDSDLPIEESLDGAERNTSIPRHCYSLEMNDRAFLVVIRERLVLLDGLKDGPETSGIVPSTFVEHLTTLSDEELLLGGQFLRELLDSNLLLSTADGTRLIKRFGEFIGSDEWTRCEVSQCLCLDMLIGIGQQWIQGGDANLTMLATDIYHWFLDAGEKWVRPPEVEKRFATLLLLLARLDQNNDILPAESSPRTSLIKILHRSNISVKFFVGNRLPKFFDIYLTDTHDDVFLDILKHLPSNSDWIDGIAFRLFVLAKIASQWPDLLRRCIYHIFEIPPRVPNAMRHATRCLKDLSIALNVDSPRKLLALFAPQILYTWLEGSSILEIPFQIFGYPTLKDLLLDVKQTAAGLLIMRGQEESFEALADLLGTKEYELLRTSFTQIMAYMIAHDMSTPPVKNQRRLGEPWLVKRLGNVAFLECLNYHFADIIALLFNTIDHSDMEKYLLRKKEHLSAGKIMGEIRSYNRSQVKLPHHQQPAFKSKYLTDWINHLCIKTQYHPEALYTPSLVTAVARTLLNSIHPALGPMHSCTVLRKLCALICLAGNTAIRGYPLEMLLQAVSMYITTAECAEDASGILQYLLIHGKIHLSMSPSFVAGAALSILGRLRILLDQRQTSTTQDSQYKATKSKAQVFHAWLGKYFLEYKSPMLKVNQQARFYSLVQSACEIGLTGNAETGTPESDLLFRLLEDEQRSESLLSQPSRELALSMLCSDFNAPKSFRRDIFGSDQAAVNFAAVVWNSSRRASASKQYLSWAGRVLGRAFAASGHLHPQLLQESSLSQLNSLSPSSEVRPEYASKSCLLNLIQSLTLSPNQRTVGLAEVALRSILTTVTTTAEEPALLETCYECLSKSLAEASSWPPYVIPPSGMQNPDIDNINDPFTAEAITKASWLRDLSIVLARFVPNDAVLNALVPILQGVSGFADEAFPFILHLALSISSTAQHLAKKSVSRSILDWFSISETVEKTRLRMLINSLLYLRTQPHLEERSSRSGSHWLDIDYIKAAVAATNCGMYKTALLFVEEFCSKQSTIKPSRRSSAIGHDPAELPQDLLLNIFKNIDDPDLYYGVRQNASFKTILARLEYERDGPKSLAFRGAQYDSRVRHNDPRSAEDGQSLVKALDVLSLSGLSYSLLQAQQSAGITSTSLYSMFETARKLEKWDIPVPINCVNDSLTIYKAFQAVQNTSNYEASLQIINEGFECTMASLIQNESSANALHGTLQTLASLVELDEVISTRSSVEFESMLTRFDERSGWMRTGRFDDVSQILSCRGTTLSTLSQNPRLQTIVGIVPLDARLVEVHTALLASDLNRSHNALQESLTVTTALISLIDPCKDVGLTVEAAIRLEEAHVLWDQGEMASSIGMLQDLWEGPGLDKQTISIGRADLLSRIGSQISVARLEKPDDILQNYLKPALSELKGKCKGEEAGKVFHQFAVFCDQQLQDPDSIEDLERLERLRREKADDVDRLSSMLTKTPNSKDKRSISAQLAKSKTWLKIDDDELHRHRKSREEFLQKCLENYLLALQASDEHDKNALRLTALWLEHSGEAKANATVAVYLDGVPTRKFAPLMNQLSSRLQDSAHGAVTTVSSESDPLKSGETNSATSFQKQLFSLVLRICIDHPFSGMYQIYATAHSRPNQKDEAAVSRRNAAGNISKRLLENSKSAVIWSSILHTNKVYCLFAAEKDDRYKSGRKIALKESPNGRALQNTIAKYPVPPPTMRIKLAADCDYSRIPSMSRLDPQIAIASGVSCPKVITVVGTDGLRYKQLVKGGNDDLRQDAIMEQVFEQVSELLKINRSTRQRDLGIRTYKVLPLTSIAGIIEFVPDTIPLHEYLMPAHERYHPKDLKGQQCRKEIQDVQARQLQERVKVYRSVTERFHPVMRYFFIEKFNDPDEWFIRRLAYTRSTAAISILGHVLGLGDRHGHNILLDAKSGEVVHIDLGVAFEMGRILPVPEVVPFRLTRDIVDGMGITKTEGVFRRCCEFTLEALRKEASSINAILDVLRYDPLYSWSVSPLRLAKLQEGHSAAALEEADAEVAPIPQKTKQKVNEPGEADRALTMINKKLSKTLSVTATVNDLINQAVDEKNLAVLYSGWAAYA